MKGMNNGDCMLENGLREARRGALRMINEGYGSIANSMNRAKTRCWGNDDDDEPRGEREGDSKEKRNETRDRRSH